MDQPHLALRRLHLDRQRQSTQGLGHRRAVRPIALVESCAAVDPVIDARHQVADGTTSGHQLVIAAEGVKPWPCQFSTSADSGPRSTRSPTANRRSRPASKPTKASAASSRLKQPWISPTSISRPRWFRSWCRTRGEWEPGGAGGTGISGRHPGPPPHMNPLFSGTASGPDPWCRSPPGNAPC